MQEVDKSLQMLEEIEYAWLDSMSHLQKLQKRLQKAIDFCKREKIKMDSIDTLRERVNALSKFVQFMNDNNTSFENCLLQMSLCCVTHMIYVIWS